MVSIVKDGWCSASDGRVKEALCGGACVQCGGCGGGNGDGRGGAVVVRC